MVGDGQWVAVVAVAQLELAFEVDAPQRIGQAARRQRCALGAWPPTHTGADRVAKMRFEFEFADPSHLESVLRTIKRIDSVYDVYRVMSADAKNEPSVDAHPASNLHA